jgi:hypothetical protein
VVLSLGSDRPPEEDVARLAANHSVVVVLGLVAADFARFVLHPSATEALNGQLLLLLALVVVAVGFCCCWGRTMLRMVRIQWC